MHSLSLFHLCACVQVRSELICCRPALHSCTQWLMRYFGNCSSVVVCQQHVQILPQEGAAAEPASKPPTNRPLSCDVLFVGGYTQVRKICPPPHTHTHTHTPPHPFDFLEPDKHCDKAMKLDYFSLISRKPTSCWTETMRSPEKVNNKIKITSTPFISSQKN